MGKKLLAENSVWKCIDCNENMSANASISSSSQPLPNCFRFWLHVLAWGKLNGMNGKNYCNLLDSFSNQLKMKISLLTSFRVRWHIKHVILILVKFGISQMITAANLIILSQFSSFRIIVNIMNIWVVSSVKSWAKLMTIENPKMSFMSSILEHNILYSLVKCIICWHLIFDLAICRLPTFCLGCLSISRNSTKEVLIVANLCWIKNT